jgi:hypothetical protein
LRRARQQRNRKRHREHQAGPVNSGLDGNHEAPRRNEMKTAD